MNFFPTTVRDLLYMVILFLAYVLAAQLFALLYVPLPAYSPAILPASGIALAGLMLGGIALWPAILLGAVVNHMLYGMTFAVALGIGLANVIQAITAAWLLRKFGFRNSFSRVPHTLVFILVTLFITVIAPALGTLAIVVSDETLSRGVLSTLIPWWIGHIFSVLIFTPLLVRWLPRISFHRTRIELIETSLAILSIIGVGILLYWTPFREVAQVPLVYLVLVPLLWIALRIGPRFMTIALFLNAALALGGASYLSHTTGDLLNLSSALQQTEIFVIMISFIFLLLVTVAEERKDTANDLRDNVRRLENAINRIRKEDEAKSRFIATLAHELRNPLSPLMSSLEIMRLSRLDASQTTELAESMTENLKTMRHLLDDLLDISRISREKLSLQKEQVDLGTVINRSIRTVARLIEEREHTLEAALPDTAILFEADPVRLEQVFVNLLNNAAKYTEPGGTITIAADVRNDMAIISVKDTGIGMNAGLLEHVFEPFFQIEQPGKLHSGLGIGLSLTKNLVEMHGGTIEARSEGLNRGSEFRVCIPLTGVTREQDTPVVAMRDEGEGFRIFIVDDNRAAADSLAKLLTLRGNVTATTYTGTDAITNALTFAPDVILLDIGLPDMSGYDVARALRTDGAYTGTLIALTGYGQDSDIRKATKAGFNHHLTKPAGLAEIEEILANVART